MAESKTYRQRMQHAKRARLYAERFETGASKTASFLSYFTEEQSEIRLIVDGEKGEFGIGREHLYECLKRLSIAQPKFVEKLENQVFEEVLGEIADERDKSHTFLITTQTENNFSPEIVQKLNVLSF